MKLLHLADLHLDSPFIGLSKHLQAIQDQLIQAPYQAFERAVSVAINRQVDIVLIAGDVYNADRPSIYAQHFFLKQLDRLHQAQIPVVFSHGNHDYIKSDKYHLNLPENTHVFEDDQVTYFDLDLSNGEQARIYGFSYTSRWIHDRKVQEFPVNPQITDYTIGMLHGSEEGIESEKGTYAPFTVAELVNKHYDYWALGHIHQAGVLNQAPLIQYAGTSQGRHRNESGDKGAYIVTLSPNQPADNEFVSLAEILFKDSQIQCQEDWTLDKLLEALESTVTSYKEEGQARGQAYLLSIELKDLDLLDADVIDRVEAGELNNVLTTLQDLSDPFVAILEITYQMNPALNVFDYDVQLKESFQDALDFVQEADHYQAIMADFFGHPLVQTRLNHLRQDQELKERIYQEARTYLLRQFGLERKEGKLDED